MAKRAETLIEGPDGVFSSGAGAEVGYDAESDESALYQTWREQLKDAGQSRIRVLRIPENVGNNKAGARESYLFSAPVELYNFDQLSGYIHDHYGGGLYRIMGIREGVSGPVFNRLLKIEADKSPPPKENGAASNELAAVLEQFSRAQAEANSRFDTLLTRLTEARPAAPDPMAQFQGFATLLTTMRPLFTPPALPAPAPAVDLLAELTRIKEVAGLLGMDGGGSNNDDSGVIGKLIDKFGGPLAEVVLRGAAAQAAAGPPQLPRPGIRPAITPAANPNPENPTMTTQPIDANAAQLQKQVTQLLMAARVNADPAVVADAVLDQTPEEKYEELFAFMASPDCMAQLIAVNSDVQNFAPWFNALKAEIISQLSPEEAAPVDAGPGPGGVGPGIQDDASAIE